MNDTNVDMHGKTVLVTGATQGIGRVTARELARQGATTVLVARDRARGEAVVAEIQQQTGNQAVSLLIADLSSQASIRALAEAFTAKHDALHVLVNNAGSIFIPRQTTVDGLEMTFATNHLGYFLLTHLLLDVLRASAPARIVNVASAAHRRATLDFDDLQSERGYSGMGAYSRSKLANILYTYELARRLEGSGVTANCLHPGVVRTGFGRNTQGIFKLGVKLIAPFMLSDEQGADTSIYLASAPEVEGVTGKYFAKREAIRSNPQSHDRAAAERLWDISLEMCGLAAPGS